MNFGLLGDYDALPDLDVIAEGIEASLAELLALARGEAPPKKTPKRRKAKTGAAAADRQPRRWLPGQAEARRSGGRAARVGAQAQPQQRRADVEEEDVAGRPISHDRRCQVRASWCWPVVGGEKPMLVASASRRAAGSSAARRVPGAARMRNRPPKRRCPRPRRPSLRRSGSTSAPPSRCRRRRGGARRPRRSAAPPSRPAAAARRPAPVLPR